MQIKTMPLGDMGANCHIITDDDGITAVVDPGYPDEALFAAIEGSAVRYIFLTHGHFDHIMGAAAVKERTGAQVVMHADDVPMLTDENLSLACEMYPGRQTPVTPDILVADGDVVDFAGGVEVLHTPGHTPGSVCYKLGNVIFTGDTLFCLTVGRTDFPGGSIQALIRSVDRLFALPGDYVLYTGHNRATTMDAERKHNRFVRKKNAYLNSQS